jgi:hypothetical protein
MQKIMHLPGCQFSLFAPFAPFDPSALAMSCDPIIDDFERWIEENQLFGDHQLVGDPTEAG